MKALSCLKKIERKIKHKRTSLQIKGRINIDLANKWWYIIGNCQRPSLLVYPDICMNKMKQILRVLTKIIYRSCWTEKKPIQFCWWVVCFSGRFSQLCVRFTWGTIAETNVRGQPCLMRYLIISYYDIMRPHQIYPLDWIIICPAGLMTHMPWRQD